LLIIDIYIRIPISSMRIQQRLGATRSPLVNQTEHT